MNQPMNSLVQFLETPRTLSEIVYEHSGYKRVFNHIDKLQKYYNEQNKKYVTKNEVAISDDKQPLMTVVEQQEYNVIWKSYVKKSPENLIQKREEVMPKEAQPPFRVYKSFEDLYRMHKALEEIKEKHKVGVQKRTEKIVEVLKELVERGIIRVAMEFMENRNNNNALFLFCKRRIMQPIHVVNPSMMRRGDLFVEGRAWKLVNQRRCKQRGDGTYINRDLFRGKSSRSIHNIKVTVNLLPFAPYFAAQNIRNEFKRRIRWNKPSQSYETKRGEVDGLVDTGSPVSNGNTTTNDVRKIMGDDYYFFFSIRY